MKSAIHDFVRHVLLEARQSAESASQLCLFQYDRTYTLYDGNSLIRKISSLIKEIPKDISIIDILHKEVETDQESTKEWIVGTISANSTQHPCWGAHTINSVAALKGYGPLMYDIVMSEIGPIISDRSLVSKQADSIWQRYSVSDWVKKKKLDDINDPKTPPREDDCKVHSKPGTEHLNFAYEIVTPIDTQSMKSNHMATMKKIMSIGRSEITIPELQAVLNAAADNFFDIKYAERVR